MEFLQVIVDTIGCYNITMAFSNVEKEVYNNGDVELTIAHLTEEDTRYWIKGSVGCIEFRQGDFDNLLELLISYDVEVNQNDTRKSLRSKRDG